MSQDPRLCSVCKEPTPDICFSKGSDWFCQLACLRAFQVKLREEKDRERQNEDKNKKNLQTAVDTSGGGGCH